jgi:hypothetical protein
LISLGPVNTRGLTGLIPAVDVMSIIERATLRQSFLIPRPPQGMSARFNSLARSLFDR